MGWWSIRKDTKELYDPCRQSSPADESELLNIGDQPMDAIEAALKKVAKIYKRDLKRKPTPDELTALLESSIRTLEEDVFDDMEERELDSVTIKLRKRPKRPRPKPGDIFAVPLPSGGYGYGRVMKVTLKVLLWMKLLDVRSDNLLSMEDVKKAKAILDLHTRTQKIDSVEWPIVGQAQLTDSEQADLANEPRWIMGYTAKSVEEIAEWKLARKKGLPPNMNAPYEGYRG